MHKLTIEDDEGKTVVVPLIRDEVTVGRQDGNSIRLTERNISRRHARFFRKDGQLYVEDLASYTGIKVGNARITDVTLLKDGDLVVIGDYKLTVRTERPTATQLYGGGLLPFAPSDGGTKPMPLPGGSSSGLSAPAPLGTAPLPLGGAAIAVPPAEASPSAAASAELEQRPVPSGSSAPAPDASLDAAPTIPVRTLAEQGLAAGEAPPAARLVVTATSLAGAEFSLDRASLVIGRTPENDIVLNHKSISRHHAKIIRDGDKYIVVDLESANGVRVNGVEFERVELQSGDTLELGHVRMKFTSGNEYIDFDAGGDGTNKRALLIGGAVAAFAIAGLVLTFAVGGDGSKTAMTTPANPTTTATAPVPVTAPPGPAGTSAPVGVPSPGTAAAPTPPAVPEPATPPPPAVPPVPEMPPRALEKLLADARSAMDRRKWSEAAAKLDKAIEAAPASADALAMRKTVEAETVTMEKFTRLEAAGRARNFVDINQIAGEIPENSVYRARATSIRDAAAKRFVAARMIDVDRFVSRGACADARQEAEKVLAVQPDNQRAKSAPERCETLVAAKTRRQTERAQRPARAETAPVAAAPREAPAPRVTEPRVPAAPRSVAERPSPVARPTRETRAAASAPPETGDPEALLQEAQQAWLRGQFAAAIDSARRALRARPNLPRAYQIIAVCSCSLRDADSATKAYDRLDDRMRPLVKSACQKSGIALN